MQQHGEPPLDRGRVRGRRVVVVVDWGCTMADGLMGEGGRIIQMVRKFSRTAPVLMSQLTG